MSIVGDFVSNSIGIHYQLRLPDSRLGLQAMTRGAGSAPDVFFSRNSPHQLPIHPDDVFLTAGIGEDSRVGAYLHLVGTGRLDDISFLAPIGPYEISTLLVDPQYLARFNNVLSLSEIAPHHVANRTHMWKSPQPSARESRANSKEAQDLLKKCQGTKNTLPNLPLPQMPESKEQDRKDHMRSQSKQESPYNKLTPREKYAFFVSALRNGNWGQDIIDACLGRHVGTVEANIAQAVGGLQTFDFADRQVVTYVETLQQLQASVLGTMERARDGVYYRKVTSLG